MLIFIDESGCPGFKLTKGSTQYFVVAMVIFEDTNDAEQTAIVIKNLSQSLSANYEFKFSDSNDKRKDLFFNAIQGCNFTVRAIAVDKSKLHSIHMREDSESFYSFFLKSLLKYDNGILDNASIKVDGSGDREFRNALQKYLKNNLPQGKIVKFRFEDSKRNVLIQLADMVSGAIYRSYKSNCTKGNQGKWRLMLRKQIKDVWDFR